MTLRQPIEKISSKGYSGFYIKCSVFVFSYFRAFPPAKLLRRSFGALAKAESCSADKRDKFI
jgi:hypothetical protein